MDGVQERHAEIDTSMSSVQIRTDATACRIEESPFMTEDEFAQSNVDVFTTQTTIRASISIDALITFLRARKATGEIRILLNQGGKQQVLLTEHTKLKEDDREIIRKLLKI